MSEFQQDLHRQQSPCHLAGYIDLNELASMVTIPPTLSRYNRVQARDYDLLRMPKHFMKADSQQILFPLTSCPYAAAADMKEQYERT